MAAAGGNGMVQSPFQLPAAGIWTPKANWRLATVPVGFPSADSLRCLAKVRRCHSLCKKKKRLRKRCCYNHYCTVAVSCHYCSCGERWWGTKAPPCRSEIIVELSVVPCVCRLPSPIPLPSPRRRPSRRLDLSAASPAPLPLPSGVLASGE
jgi:hypothetical protein